MWCLSSLPSRGAWIEICRAAWRTVAGWSSLPSRGAWIEIQLGRCRGQRAGGRSPHGERGLKCTEVRFMKEGVTVSLPSRGAWIEMLLRLRSMGERWSRSPHGERGLKFGQLVQMVKSCGSLPSRGAWIEMARSNSPPPLLMSLPSRGAWIEMGFWTLFAMPALVAPLTGSVD